MLRNNADRCSPMLIFRAWATCGFGWLSAYVNGEDQVILMPLNVILKKSMKTLCKTLSEFHQLLDNMVSSC